MHSTPTPGWISRSALLLICAWPLSLHMAILLHAQDWAPRLTALAAALAAVLWALAARRRSVLLWAAAVIACLAWLVWAAPQLLLFAPPIAINTALALVFGASLRPQHEPVISVFARLEQGELPADLARYTRRLTWTWTALFATMAATSLVLAVAGTLQTWSLFANVINYALVALLFAGEYLYRKYRFRHYRHATLAQLVRNVRSAGLFSARNRPMR
jgi:uncharacterized membrane protein